MVSIKTFGPRFCFFSFKKEFWYSLTTTTVIGYFYFGLLFYLLTSGNMAAVLGSRRFMIILLLLFYSFSSCSYFADPSWPGLLKYSDVWIPELFVSFLFLDDCLLLNLLKNYFEDEVELVVNYRVKYWPFLEVIAVIFG